MACPELGEDHGIPGYRGYTAPNQVTLLTVGARDALLAHASLVEQREQGQDSSEVAMAGLLSEARTNFGEVVSLTQGAMLQRAQRYSGVDSSLANDLVQATYERAWRFLPNYAARSQAETWLIQILFSRYHNEVKRWVRRPVQPLEALTSDEHMQLLASREPGPELRVLQADRNMRIVQLLNNLPPERRRLVMEKYGFDMTFPEISKRTGVPEMTLKVRAHRGRKRLREIGQTMLEDIDI